MNNKALTQFNNDNNNINYNLILYENNLELFYQWLVGFVDGEGSFQINSFKDSKGNITKFSFLFKINLHIDDKDVLFTIIKLLGMGKVYTTISKSNGKKANIYICTLCITRKEDLYKLISIFDKYPLNGIKYLDYIDFVKAYNLYFNRKNGILTKELISQILNLKNNMNKNRTNFNMPLDHKIIISDYYLLGLIEGEGSFHFIRTRAIASFDIKLTVKQKPLLLNIKQYLKEKLEFDTNSLWKINNSQLININSLSKEGNAKPQIVLNIKNIRILYNYLIPYLSKLLFLTKKFKDFNDFKIICRTLYYRIHKNSEMKSLLIKLSYSMNNFRLSSYSGNIPKITKEEKSILKDATPICKPLSDGRILNLKMNKLDVAIKGGSIFKIITPQGEVLLVDNLTDCVNIIGVSRNILHSAFGEVNEAKSDIIIKNYKIKRIGILLG